MGSDSVDKKRGLLSRLTSVSSPWDCTPAYVWLLVGGIGIICIFLVGVAINKTTYVKPSAFINYESCNKQDQGAPD